MVITQWLAIPLAALTMPKALGLINSDCWLFRFPLASLRNTKYLILKSFKRCLHPCYKMHTHTCTAGKAEGMHERDDGSITAGGKDDAECPGKQVQGKVQSTLHTSNMAKVAKVTTQLIWLGYTACTHLTCVL